MKPHKQRATSESVLSHWREDLLQSPRTPGVVQYFETHVSEIAMAMLLQTKADVPELAAAPTEIIDRVHAHCVQHVESTVKIMHAGFDLERRDFSFVRENAAIRAREGYPLSALLQAYRAGHKATWGTMCGLFAGPGEPLCADSWRTVLALSLLAMEYTNLASNTAAEAYSAEAQHIARITGHARTEFLEGLLTEPLEASAAIARRFSLKPEGEFVAFVARLDEGESTSDEQLLDAARNVERILSNNSKEYLVGVRHTEIVGVINAATTACDLKLETILREFSGQWMGGSPFFVGVSTIRPGLDSVVGCYEDARHAINHASTTHPIVRFCDVPPFDHLVATADSSTYRLRPAWLTTLVAENNKSDGALLTTLRAYLDAGLSVKRTASSLSIHINTVYHRLHRVEEITGQDSHDIPGLLNVITVMSLHGLLE